MKTLAHIAAAFYFQPWGILPERHGAMGRILDRHLRGDATTFSEEGLRATVERPALGEWRPQGEVIVGPCDANGEPLIPQMQKVGRLAIIPVFGVLGRHLSFLSLWCGGCDYTHVEEMAALAEADPMIETVVFYFRSPGGMVVGCEECVSVIAGMRKETVAYSDDICCSCAYWLASGCDQVVFSPSAMVGNVGSFIAALDNSGEWAENGWKRELFRSGPLKAAGISGKAWTDAERKSMQARVDAGFAAFRGHVGSRRAGVAPEVFDGAWYHGREGMELGLCDGLANSLAEVLAAVA